MIIIKKLRDNEHWARGELIEWGCVRNNVGAMKFWGKRLNSPFIT